MYVAIVRMETPAVDHDMAVQVSLSSTEKFAAMKDKGLLMKYYLSRDSGGSGGVFGTIIGVLIIGVLRNGLNLLSVSPFLQAVIIGGVIVLAVGAETFKHRSK